MTAHRHHWAWIVCPDCPDHVRLPDGHMVSRLHGTRPLLDTAPPALSPRQREVLQLIADGMSRDEAAAKLGISEWTIKTVLRHIARKYGVGERAGMVAVGFRTGELT